MTQLYDLTTLLEKPGLPERTVRYYLAKVLEAPGGTPGRKAWYTQETLEQLLLARDVLMREYDPKRGEVKPSLRDFKDWLRTLSEEEIREMVEMPYRVKPKMLTTYSAPVAKQIQAEPLSASSESMPNMESLEDLPDSEVNEHSAAYSRKSGEEDKKNIKDSAMDYLDRVMSPEKRREQRRREQHHPPPHRQPPVWKTRRFGNDLEIRTRTRLTPGQERQIELAGQLLEAMLKEGQT
jgi:hypothetical protein